MHDPQFSKFRQTIALNSPGLFGDASASYSLTLYPSAEFFEVYSTSNPTIATVGAVCIIIFTSLLFFLYDFFVRQEFHQTQAILQAKRQFMRFVSHEVRTPLNSVCLGLKLLQDEMIRFAGSKSSKENPKCIPMEVQLQDTVTDWSNLSEDIMVNARSAVDVLNDLLNYDKIEMGTLQLELTVVPIWLLVKRTASEFKLQAKKKNISFVQESTELSQAMKERNVVGDTIRIAQVLRNLVSNALKFTPEGGKIYWYLAACRSLRLIMVSQPVLCNLTIQAT